MDTTYDSIVEQIGQSVFSTMLNFDAARSGEPSPPDHEMLLAAVHVAGGWTGTVVLALSADAARASAAAMFRIPESETSDADRQEVAAELVNMIGGNLKSVLPGPSFLSLPTIVSGSDFALQVRDAELMDDVLLACEAGLLRLRVYVKKRADGDAGKPVSI